MTSCSRGVRNEKHSRLHNKDEEGASEYPQMDTAPTLLASPGWTVLVSVAGRAQHRGPEVRPQFPSPDTGHGPRGAWLNAQSPRTQCQPPPPSGPLPSAHPPGFAKETARVGEKWLVPLGHHPTVHVSVLSSEKYTRPQASPATAQHPPIPGTGPPQSRHPTRPPPAQDQATRPLPRHSDTRQRSLWETWGTTSFKKFK